MTARELSPEFNISFHIIGLLYKCMIETLNIISDGQEMIPFTKQIFDSSIDLDQRSSSIMSCFRPIFMNIFVNTIQDELVARLLKTLS